MAPTSFLLRQIKAKECRSQVLCTETSCCLFTTCQQLLNMCVVKTLLPNQKLFSKSQETMLGTLSNYKKTSSKSLKKTKKNISPYQDNFTKKQVFQLSLTAKTHLFGLWVARELHEDVPYRRFQLKQKGRFLWNSCGFFPKKTGSSGVVTFLYPQYLGINDIKC